MLITVLFYANVRFADGDVDAMSDAEWQEIIRRARRRDVTITLTHLQGLVAAMGALANIRDFFTWLAAREDRNLLVYSPLEVIRDLQPYRDSVIHP